jgi:hypothetical protein
MGTARAELEQDVPCEAPIIPSPSYALPSRTIAVDSVPLRIGATEEPTDIPSKRDRCPNPETIGTRCNRRTRTNRPPCDTSSARPASRRTRATQRVQKVLSPANDLTGSSGADFEPNLLASPFGFDVPGGGHGVEQEESPPSVRTRPRFSQVRLGDWTPIDDLHFDGVPRSTRTIMVADGSPLG